MIRTNSWPKQVIFQRIQKDGKISKMEMYRVFNMGIGMAMIVHKDCADTVVSNLLKSGETAWKIGKIQKGSGRVLFKK